MRLPIGKGKVTIACLFILIFWILIALLPLFFSPLLTTSINLPERLQNPSTKYFLGTNSEGESITILIINGANTSIVVSFFTVFTCLFLGIPLGACAGYFGGKIDAIISRIIDILMSFPPLILPIAIMAFLGGGLLNVVLALSLTGWDSYARLIRGQFIAFKKREFVIAAKSLGASNARIICKHIFPNIISPLAVQSTFSLAGVILAEAGLSFLGLGVNSSLVSWGSLLNVAKDYIMTNPTMVLFPSLALFSVITSLNFLGETLRLTFDPKNRHT